MVNEVFTSSDFQIAETQLLRDVEQSIQETADVLANLSEDLKRIEAQKTVEKAAHIEAINFITDHAQEMLTNAFMQAIFESVEYNHGLFIGRSQEAISAHWQDVLSVVPLQPGKVEVNIDFAPLGDIENYAYAVQQTREKLGFKMKNRPESRAIYWERRIYGVDREGKTVMTKPRPNSKNEPRDITENYEGKWTRTVETRLSFLQPDEAPWWYILNYGNVDAFNDSEAMPYPVIEGTYFIEALETQIKEIFNRIYSESLQSWEDWYADLIADDYGLKQFDDFDNIANAIEPDIVKKIESGEELEPTNKAIGIIEQDGKVYELYVTSKGKIGRRYSLSKN